MPEARLRRVREAYEEVEPVRLTVRQSWLDEHRHLLKVAERINLVGSRFLLSEQPEADTTNVYDTAETPWGV